MPQPTPARDYYLAHVNDQTDECVLWPFATTSEGYGKIRWEGIDRRVHVLACIEHHGPCPSGMEAAHGPCHQPGCFNGRHLSWKPHRANIADKRRDGTRVLGEGHHMTTLTVAQVLALRADAGRGATFTGLGVKYGIHRSTAARIVQRSTWAHV